MMSVLEVLLLAIAIGMVVTLIATVIGFNLKSPGKRIEHRIKPVGLLDSITVMRSIGQLLGPPLVSGNKITSLHNGDQIFPAMLEAIASAEKTITFETFIYWAGDIGQKFAEALSQKAKSGVRVHVLLDWMGSRSFEESALEKMRAAGVAIERYRPIRWYTLARLNNRTHRKIMVIDGKLGFTGGVGIADQWKGNAQDEDHWRDSHFRVEGPVVAQLQSAFLDNWNTTNPEVLHGDDYFPELKPMGDICAQVFKSSPEEGSGSVRLMFLYSIAHATKSIRIANAYFVPDSHLRQLLAEAVARGVKVEVIIPGKWIDTITTRRASRSLWGELLTKGIHIYEYQRTMFHCKYMIVDEMWSSVGSTNLDNRSLRLNDECNLNGVDRVWAKELSEMFADDLANSKQVTFEAWANRPLGTKVADWLSSKVRSQV